MVVYEPQVNRSYGVSDEARFLTVAGNDALLSVERSSVYHHQIAIYRTRLQFDKLKRDWIKETKYFSSIQEKLSNINYRLIFQNKNSFIQFIIEDFYSSNLFWFDILENVFQYNPIKEEHLGQFDKMKNDWIEWLNYNYDRYVFASASIPQLFY